MEAEPCTCGGIEVMRCTKLCVNAAEYPAMAGEAEYLSWFPIRRTKGARRVRPLLYMDPQRMRELAATRGVSCNGPHTFAPTDADTDDSMGGGKK